MAVVLWFARLSQIVINQHKSLTQIAYKKQFGNIKLAMTEKFSKEILSLPIGEHLKLDDIKKVCILIKNFFNDKIS